MNMPFYVSPEQVMKDRADYARKGIARGRSLVALECAPGVLIVADNGSRTLSKISEIYDRVAFAAVGKYNEFQMLRVAGVRHADLKGYSYSREDVSAKELANAYAQTLGQVFTHEMKPYEVELLVAEVGRSGDDHAEMYHLFYDGVVMDEQRYAVLGGQAEQITEALATQYEDGMELGPALKLGARVLGSEGESLSADQLEVALLERARPRRAFRRIKNAELDRLLDYRLTLSTSAAPARAVPRRARRGPARRRCAHSGGYETRAAVGRRRSGRRPRRPRRRATRCSLLRSDRRARRRRPRARSPTVKPYGPPSEPRSSTSNPSSTSRAARHVAGTTPATR